MDLPGRGPSEDQRHEVPPVLWPVPLVDALDLIGGPPALPGRRIVVGDQAADRVGHWLYAQRAATRPHTLDGAICVGVLAESDWYRRQRDASVPAVPHAVPAARIYLEVEHAIGPGDESSSPDQSDLAPERRSASLVAEPAVPPVRWPRRADRELRTTGARCWILGEHGIQSGFRAVGEPRRREVGTVEFGGGLDGLDDPVISTSLPVVVESDWYAWHDTGTSPPRHWIVESALTWLE